MTAETTTDTPHNTSNDMPHDMPHDMPMWTPDADAVHETNMYHFMSFAEERLAIPAGDYQELWDFSISDRAAFWDMFRRFANLHAETWGNRVLVDGDRMPGAQWP